jgi:hypothetical protein
MGGKTPTHLKNVVSYTHWQSKSMWYGGSWWHLTSEKNIQRKWIWHSGLEYKTPLQKKRLIVVTTILSQQTTSCKISRMPTKFNVMTVIYCLRISAYGWQSYHHLWADCLDNVGSSTSHMSPWPVIGIALPFSIWSLVWDQRPQGSEAYVACLVKCMWGRQENPLRCDALRGKR